MRTRKLLQVVPLCVLLLLFAVPLALSQQQKTWSKLVKHADKTVKGKYKADLVIPDGGTSEPAMNVQEARLRGESIRRSKLSAYIEAAKLAELAAKGSQNKSRLSSNLPRSHYKSIAVREKIRRYKNVTIGDGICQSIDIRNNVVFFAILQQCRVIEGFLQIVLIENNDEIEFQNISFPKLREITGYFLMYRVNGIKSLSNLFPNLEVIRGDILLTDYAFMVYEMKNLQEIGLRKLTQISRGGVRIEKNPSLCYTNTLNWDIIVTAGDNFIKDNGNDGSCPGCSQCPSGHCWTAQHCQRMEKPNCHEQCLGECFGPTEKDCYVCKHFQHQGKCVERCPPHLYAYLSRRCITKAECQNMSRVRRVFKNEIEQTWRPYNGSCLTQCPEGYEDDLDADNKTTCRICQNRCRKIGNGAIIRHISDAQSYRGTTIVRGALEFQIRNGNPNIMNELTDAFGLIEEITEYIKVTHSFPITSLGFFKKLKVIKGERLDINNASVVVLDNPNLSSLFPESQKIKIENGRLFFHYNPKLCLSKIIQFGNMVNITNLTELEVQPESNGEKVACDIVNINITIKEMGADYVDLMWDSYKPSRGQHLLSYLLSYIETENENITYEANACGNNAWQIVDVDVDFRSYSNFTQVVAKHISNLKPYTKYAVYVKTFTARNRRQERSSTSSPVGQSEIIFFRTKSTIPSMPINLAFTAVSDTETLVKWDPPTYPNGPIGYYMISGSVRNYNKELLSSRNYCTNILLDEPEEQAVPEVTIKIPIITPLSYCSKDVAPMKMITSKKFEIFCHENVTISYMSPGWKDYCVFNRYNSLDDFHELLDDMSSTDVGEKFEKSVNVSDPFDYTKRTLVEGQTFLYNVSAGNNSYLLRDLRYFSLYTISISACGVKTSDEAQMCSTVQYINARTGRREDADNVNNVKVSVTNNTIVEVSWDPVKEPNGMTVSYTIEYTNLDVKDAKKSTECIPWTLHKDTYTGYYIKNLSPGRYSLRVRSTSLAGDGNFSKAVWFSIGLTDENPIVFVSLLTLGCLSVILLMACLFYRSYLRKKQQEKLIASVNPDYIETKYIVDSWEVARECVEILEELGLGNFGMVYRGRLDNGVEVAIKTISETASPREKNEFLNEASVMKNFSTFHLIKLLGVVSIGNPPFVIMELMENGDLKAYLRRIRDTNLIPNASRIMRMAAEIADGMAYLESKKFVHRDLAARNCMVSKDMVCKVGDFGMVRDIYETEYYKIGKKGLLPIRWMAPENLCDGVFTSDSDVWSFGVVLYEILTLAEIPYQGFTNEEVMSYVLHKGVLNIPRNCPENIYKIMEKCFKWRPSDRPTFMEIVAELEPFLGQDFCEKSFYHSEDGVEIRNAGIKKVYHHAAPIRFHWGNETARWVREFEDNVTLLDQTKAGTSRSRIFKNGFQHFGNVTNLEDVPLDR